MWRIDKGDSRKVLASIEAGTYDSCVCDPPYGLGTREPTVEELVRFLQGEDTLRTGKDFMSRNWSVPSVPLWREVFRVMKPGAHIAAFAGTRAVDLIMMGLRAAGFEVRDSIAWHFFSGFPKSLNVSKAIDRAAGAEREVVGSKLDLPGYHLHPHVGGEAFGHGIGSSTSKTRLAASQVTAPATEAAKKWDGWGTALKPSHEYIVIARKPLDGTVAGNVLRHGTGAINVDACRVGTDWSERSDAWKRSGHTAKPGAGKIAAPDGQGINCHPGGRWPPDALFSHAEGCQMVGRKRVKAITGGTDTSAGYHGGIKAGVKYGENGTETIDDYVCVPGCPVLDLGDQSIVFPTFHASAKASRIEREIGTEHLPPRARTDATGRTDESAGQNNPRAGLRAQGGIRNLHACVKPNEILRWLTRLLTPPGGLVLDPFAGSGSGGCAAVAEGFDYHGIDLDEDGLDYCEVARARIAWWEAHPGGPTTEAREETALEADGQTTLF